MPEYIIGYRVYGPIQVQVSGEIGDAVFKKKAGESPVDAILEFRDVSAPDRETAEELANSDYRRRAQNIVNVLSYIIEDGFVLGESRDVQEQSGDQMYVSGHTVLRPFILKIADQIVQHSPNLLEENDALQHSLTWYSIGQGTYTPEDRLIAFWIGLEAQVENRDVLDDEETSKYHDLMDLVEEELEDYGELRNRAQSLLGLLQKESHKVAVKRNLRETFEEIDDDLDEIDDIWSDRGGIVHDGMLVDDASEKADIVEKYLRDIINKQLSDFIGEIVEFDLPLEFTDERGETYIPTHATTAPKEWLRVIFNGNVGETLSVEEIQLRAYPIFQDIQEVARINIILDSLTGWGEPLRKVSDQEYQYSPPPDWFSPEVDAVMKYLDGAGEVTSEIISHNLPEIRNDVELSVDETEVVLEDLRDLHLIERAGDYYKITIDGEGCLDGRINPRDIE